MVRTLGALFLLFPFMGIVAAGTQTHYEPNPKVTVKLPSKPDAASVQILDAPSLRAQVAIGRSAVRGDSNTPREELLAVTRAKAAELGADFVLIVGSADTTRRQSGPPGAGVGIGGVQRRGSPNILSNAPVLYATFGIFAKGTLGVEYMDAGVTWGRMIVKAFRDGSNAPAAGVQIGDQILEIDGIPYDDDRYADWILKNVPGQMVKLLLKRGESTLVVEVPLVPND